MKSLLLDISDISGDKSGIFLSAPAILESVRPGAVVPDRALYLPTFSHFVIVNKTSLSSPLSLDESY